MKLDYRIAVGILLASTLFVLLPVFTSFGQTTTNPGDPAFQILPECDPTKFPNAGEGGATGACGFTKFQELIVKVIKWLLFIIIPIAVCIFGWAGFKIMTSTGNSEAVHSAYSMIKIALIGVLIAALSYIIIVNIFNILNSRNVNITPLA